MFLYPALAVLAAIAIGRAAYPIFLERRQSKRRPVGPDGVIVGAAAMVLAREATPGVLLLHGGGDTPQALAGLARHLFENGYSVRVPLLPGHGRTLSALGSASASVCHDMVTSEYDSMRAEHDWVAIVGLSMGGALAVKLAAERQDIPALVLLAPYLAMPKLVRRLAETSPYWGWCVPYFSSRGAESIRDPDAATKGLGHGLLTPTLLCAFRDVVDAAVRALPHVRAPVLVIQSREDNRIEPESAERAFARLGSQEKRFVWTTGAGHVITVDHGHQRVFDLTTAWLQNHRAASRA